MSVDTKVTPIPADAFSVEEKTGDTPAVNEAEFAAAEKAGLEKLLADRKAAASKAAAPAEEVSAPPKEIVTAQIPGIEVMDLEDAVKSLWKAGIYAEDGMGCTGPIVRVSEANKDKAVEILKEGGYVS